MEKKILLRSRDEPISDVLLWTPTYGRAKAGRPARTYIQQLCEDTGYSSEDLPEAMNDREKWRERVRDIRASGTTRWWWWWWIYLIVKKTSPLIFFLTLLIVTMKFDIQIRQLLVYQAWSRHLQNLLKPFPWRETECRIKKYLEFNLQIVLFCILKSVSEKNAGKGLLSFVLRNYIYIYIYICLC